MKYQGSKNSHAKELLPIILADRKEGQYVYDLFCGGGNICDKINGNVVANDYNYYTTIAMDLIKNNLKHIPQNNDQSDENLYKEFRLKEMTSDIVLDGMKGYYGFALSYGGKWFGGWCRDKEGKRDYVAEAYRNAVKQSPNLQNVTFANKSYDEVELQPNSIIYLDPPYKDTTKYKTGDFDYDKFYQWCIDRHNEGHQVFISEYWLPEDKFKCVWKKEVNSSLTKDTGSKKNVEKLFIVK